MNEQIIKTTGSFFEEKEMVVDKAEEFIKQLELLEYDNELTDAVDNLNT